jgi:histone-lysine N-methyltransferase SETMAR
MYIDILCLPGEAVGRKRPEKWRKPAWFLFDDNSPAHQSVLVKDFLSNDKVTALKHPPYSPNLAATVFHLFPRLKSPFAGMALLL